MPLPPNLQAQVAGGQMDYQTAFNRALQNRAGFRQRAMGQMGQGGMPFAAPPGADMSRHSVGPGQPMPPGPPGGGFQIRGLGDIYGGGPMTTGGGTPAQGGFGGGGGMQRGPWEY